MASQVFKLVSSLALSCWSKISIGFLWNRTCLKRFLNSENVLLYTSQLNVSPFSIASSRIAPSQSQKTVIVTLPTDGNFLNFFLQNGAIPWIALFLSGSKLWTTVSSPVKIWEKVSPSVSKHTNNSKEMAFLSVLCPNIRLWGTHLMHTLEYPDLEYCN